MSRLVCPTLALCAALVLACVVVWALCWVARHADEVADLIWRKRNE